jgi:uncharacterized protein
MNGDRRRWLTWGGTAAVGAVAAGWASIRAWPDEGVFNPCLAPDTARWLAHPLVQEALQGLDMSALWDTHAHLFAVGAPAHVHGPWPEVAMRVQGHFLTNASCAADSKDDPINAYLAPLVQRLQGLPAGVKLVLLAMDSFHDESGKLQPEMTHFQVPSAWCRDAAQRWPQHFEWAASIHPYRRDAAQAVAQAKAEGARAIKWIPAAQGINPANPLCTPMYRALAQHGLPLITHGGDERATAGDDALGNPLLLRHALTEGVRVIVAHCATMGEGIDLDIGKNGPARSNFSLFQRLMNEPAHVNLLMGDLSAIGQLARTGPDLATLLQMGAPGAPWQRRLLYGSDYPIPALMPLYSSQRLADMGFLEARWVPLLQTLRRHNAWLFDLVMKRALRWQGRGFAAEVFATKRWF